MVAVESEDAWQRRLESAVSGVANALSGAEPASGAAAGGWVRPRSRGGFEHQSAVSQAVATRIGAGAPVAAAAVASLPHHSPGDADALSEWHSRQQRQRQPSPAAPGPQSPARRLGGIGRKEEEAYNISVYGDPEGPREASADPASPGTDGRAVTKPPLGSDGPTPQQRRVADAVRARAAAQGAHGAGNQRPTPRLLPASSVRESGQSVLDDLTGRDSDEETTVQKNGISHQLRTRAGGREISEELAMEREYREGIEAALQAEIAYRDQLKAKFEEQLKEERGKRERAEAVLETKVAESRAERAKRVSAEEELRRVRLELEAAKKNMGEFRQMADGACADLAAERQQARRAESDLKQTTEYSRELEALYRAGLQNSKRS
jgi:hypothetical protein